MAYMFIYSCFWYITIFIIVLLYAPDKNKSTEGIIFGIGFCVFLFYLVVYGFIFDPDSLTLYLKKDYIRIKTIGYCCCLKKNIILRCGDVQRFGVELHERFKSKSILYINNDGDKKY